MPRSPYHRGHVILRRGDGWHVPDYMPEDSPPVGLTQARRLIDAAEESGAPPLRPDSVTWDARISSSTSHNLAVHATEAAPVIGVGRGDPVRVTIRRLEPREEGEDDELPLERSQARFRFRGGLEGTALRSPFRGKRRRQSMVLSEPPRGARSSGRPYACGRLPGGNLSGG